MLVFSEKFYFWDENTKKKILKEEQHEFLNFAGNTHSYSVKVSKSDSLGVVRIVLIR